MTEIGTFLMRDDINILKQYLDKPIVLVGMMGSGKSHIGRSLAHRLGLSFYDSDAEVEARAGLSTSEIFEKFGEDKFRESEKAVIEQILSAAPCVLATGGGAIKDEQTRMLISEGALSIWLDVDMEILTSRLQNDNTRPLLNKGDLGATLQTLMDERAQYYGQADIHLQIKEEHSQETLGRLIKELCAHLNVSRV